MLIYLVQVIRKTIRVMGNGFIAEVELRLYLVWSRAKANWEGPTETTELLLQILTE